MQKQETGINTGEFEEFLTKLGEKMARFPLAPKFSKMLVEAEK